MMSKTLGARNFKSHGGFERKEEMFGVSLLEIKSQDMRLKNENDHEVRQMGKNGQGGKLSSSRLRFTSFINKKAS